MPMNAHPEGAHFPEWKENASASASPTRKTIASATAAVGLLVGMLVVGHTKKQEAIGREESRFGDFKTSELQGRPTPYVHLMMGANEILDLGSVMISPEEARLMRAYAKIMRSNEKDVSPDEQEKLIASGEKDFQEVREQNPKEFLQSYRVTESALAMAYAGRHDYTKKWLDIVLEQDPTNLYALSTYSYLLCRSNNPAFRNAPRAVALATIACTLQPENHELREILAEALAADGKFPEAIEAGTQALALAHRHYDKLHDELLKVPHLPADLYQHSGRRFIAVSHAEEVLYNLERRQQKAPSKNF